MPVTYKEDPHSGMPVPEESIVVFVDLLGFGERVTSAFEKGRGPELLRDVRDAVAHASSAFDRGYLMDGVITQVVSDSVIVGIPLRRSHRVHVLSPGEAPQIRFNSEADASALLLALGRFQRRLISQNFLVRGAVTVGLHFMGEKLAAGPALVEAVRMEAKKTGHARMPRINLHPSFVRVLNGIGGIPEHETGLWLARNYVGVGCDQRDDPLVGEGPRTYFIDYLALANLRWHDDERWPKLQRLLAKHREIIEAGATVTHSDVKEKYAWLRQYHNEFCQHPKFRTRPMESLLVP